MRTLILLLLALAISTGRSAYAQDTPPASLFDAQNQGLDTTLIGYLDERLPIQMHLKLETGDRVKGSYHYVGKTGSLQLEGRWLAGKTLELIERDDRGKVTGRFMGLWDNKRIKGFWSDAAGSKRLVWKARLGVLQDMGAGIQGQDVKVVMNEFPAGFVICGSYPTLQNQVDPLIAQSFNKFVLDWAKDIGWKGPGTDRSPNCNHSGTSTVGSAVSLQTRRVLVVDFGSEYIGAFLNHSSESLIFDLATGRKLTLQDFYKGSDGALKKLIRSRWKNSMIKEDAVEEGSECKVDPNNFTLAGSRGLSFVVSCWCPPRIFEGNVELSYGDLMVLEDGK